MHLKKPFFKTKPIRARFRAQARRRPTASVYRSTVASKRFFQTNPKNSPGAPKNADSPKKNEPKRTHFAFEFPDH